MKLLKLDAKNLFSLGEVSLDLNNRGLTLITGYSKDEGSSNGAGKSSLANKAILWCLYGETAGGLKADAVLNRHGKRKARACVEFEGVDGFRYRVTRERPAKLTLERNEKDVSAKTAKDTQLQIDTALGIDFKTFIQTSFFGQGRNLSYASLPPREQKAVLEQILPMEEVDKWALYADIQFKEIAKLVEGVQREARDCEVELGVLRGQKVDAEEAAKNFQNQRIRRIAEINTQIADLDRQQEHDKNKIKLLETSLITLDTSKLRQEKTQRVDTHNRIVSAREEIEGKLIAARSSEDQWTARKIYLVGEINTLRDAISCPTCLRPYEDSENKEARIKDINKLIREADCNISMAREATLFYTKEIKTKEAEIQDNNLQIQRLDDEISKSHIVRSEIDSIKSKLAQASDKLRYQKIAIEAEDNPYHSTIAAVEYKIHLSEETLLEINKRIGKLNGEYEHLSYWRDVYSKELKLKLFEDACPLLDNRTAFHLARLKNQQIHVEFTTIKRLATGKAKEEFNVNVWSETGGQGFDALSGGEQQMVSFAIGLALADLASSIANSASGFLILDEPFSELDTRNSESIVEYLTGEMGRDKNTIFLISNEDTLKTLIPNRIHVVKSRGVTNVAES